MLPLPSALPRVRPLESQSTPPWTVRPATLSLGRSSSRLSGAPPAPPRYPADRVEYPTYEETRQDPHRPAVMLVSILAARTLGKGRVGQGLGGGGAHRLVLVTVGSWLQPRPLEGARAGGALRGAGMAAGRRGGRNPGCLLECTVVTGLAMSSSLARHPAMLQVVRHVDSNSALFSQLL